jgi:Spy/CpxP family protein refolding chaperone
MRLITEVTMKRMSVSVMLILAVFTGVLSIPASNAAREGKEGEYRTKQGRHAGRSPGMHGFVSFSLHHLLGHAKDIGLSDEQTGKIKTITQEFQKTHIRGEADWKLAETDVQNVLHDEKSELPAIEKAMRKVADAEVALRLEGVKAFRAAKSVLTPEQREKWRGLLRASHGERAKQSDEDDEEENEKEGKEKHGK